MCAILSSPKCCEQMSFVLPLLRYRGEKFLESFVAYPGHLTSGFMSKPTSSTILTLL